MAILVMAGAFFACTASAEAATYFVSTSGNDTNDGSLAKPFRTIQKCLDVVQPGESCIIRGGTYSESLSLKKSGTTASRITVKNYNGEAPVVNPGSAKALTVGALGIGYYTIDGLTFLTSGSTGDQTYASLDFQGGWVAETSKTGGNDGFILRNCKIQGTVKFYGHHNLVENCEIDGKNKAWVTGILEWFGPSHDNIYRNNTIHHFSGRGFWSMSYTENILVEGNTVHDCSIMGIDLDGATAAEKNGVVRGNHIYNIKGGEGVGILMENAFNCMVEGNVIHDVTIGVEFFNYGTGCGHAAIDEYRDDSTNTIMKNNVIYNVYGGYFGAIAGWSIRGITVTGNTVYNIQNQAVYLEEHCGYPTRDWVIKNNIFSKTGTGIFVYGTSPNMDASNNVFHNAGTQTGTNNILSDPLFVSAGSDFHLQANSPAINTGTAIPGLIKDLDGNLRPQGSGMDIGAYEYASGSTPPPTSKKGDLNSDNKVDIIDLGIFLSNWGATTKPASDINQDGKVDIIDLGILLSNWG